MYVLGCILDSRRKVLGSAGMFARCFRIFKIMLHHKFRFHGSLAASDEGSCQLVTAPEATLTILRLFKKYASCITLQVARRRLRYNRLRDCFGDQYIDTVAGRFPDLHRPATVSPIPY
jgi:hypothetical protein